MSLIDALPPPFQVVLGCTLSPNGSVGAHVQEQCAEVLIVTHGKGEARVDGRPTALKPGVAVALPLGSTLELKNASKKSPLRYLIIKAVAQ